jgi:hypothetical protein
MENVTSGDFPKTVTFNDEERKEYAELVAGDLTAQPFSQFVKAAYHDKINAVKANRVNVSQEKIKEIFEDLIKKHSIEAARP